MMEQIVIEVEDNEVDFIMTLLSKLDFVKAEILNELPQEEKAFIEARLQHHLENQDGAVGWDDLKKNHK